MNVEELRKHCLSLPNVEESFPCDEKTLEHRFYHGLNL